MMYSFGAEYEMVELFNNNATILQKNISLLFEKLDEKHDASKNCFGITPRILINDISTFEMYIIHLNDFFKCLNVYTLDHINYLYVLGRKLIKTSNSVYDTRLVLKRETKSLHELSIIPEITIVKMDEKCHRDLLKDKIIDSELNYVMDHRLCVVL